MVLVVVGGVVVEVVVGGVAGTSCRRRGWLWWSLLAVLWY